jgi:hypothetical protein
MLNDIQITSDYMSRWVLFKIVIQPTISLEMPVPSQGHYGFYSFPVVD